ncbi:hypothetical protein Tco_0908299 [Tanacetum coccineum]|uniref:Integrase, catalytic region, zinc finger, CCHC-type, peptidase aspartic, catalytic n=1 Tax=Tanacetum coccineum TaxID=301880 RepID=A0ABQ5CMU4_9ASTR
MSMKPLQVNTKFMNHLQPEWGKFMTDVKLVKDMHKKNFDQLYAYLRQHEAHANEGRQTQGYAGNGARGEGVILDEEQMAFLADDGERIATGQDTQALTTITIFQTADLDAFDSDCDEAPSTSAVLMAKLSTYDSDVLLEVPNPATYQANNNVIDQSVQEM